IRCGRARTLSDDVALYVHGVAGGSAFGAWLVEADVEALDGLGRVSLSENVECAKRFSSFVEALAFWKQQSLVRPLRDDGLPNRPLTAFSVSPVRLSTAADFTEMEEKLAKAMEL